MTWALHGPHIALYSFLGLCRVFLARFLENKAWQTITLDSPELGIVAQKMDAALASHTALFQRAVIDTLPGISTHRLTGFLPRKSHGMS